jgi:hypothetical protein
VLRMAKETLLKLSSKHISHGCLLKDDSPLDI